MSASYSSRLDALRVWHGSIDELQTLILLLTPANVDFGPDPKHPVQYFLESWTRRKQKDVEKDRRPRRPNAERKRPANDGPAGDVASATHGSA